MGDGPSAPQSGRGPAIGAARFPRANRRTTWRHWRLTKREASRSAFHNLTAPGHSLSESASIRAWWKLGAALARADVDRYQACKRMWTEQHTRKIQVSALGRLPKAISENELLRSSVSSAVAVLPEIHIQWPFRTTHAPWEYRQLRRAPEVLRA
jgi:hypothetical protein